MDSWESRGEPPQHGVRFDEARAVLDDDEALLMPDPEHSIDEERFVLLGLCSALRMLVVIHCEVEDGEVIRISCARKAWSSPKKVDRWFTLLS
ncbi:MAG: BrnT family toxin [Gemmatimonadaceae bacterium]|nr:BrnT family toxin [Gemmatimonadaceae bacterium]